MAATTAFSYILKVPVHTHSGSRSAQPPVAARLQARDFPARGSSIADDTKFARRELIIASEKARVSAVASAHNARVSDAVNNATLIKTSVIDYTRVSTDRKLMVRTRPGTLRPRLFFPPQKSKAFE